MPRPMTWLIGMKFSVIDAGVSPNQLRLDRHHILPTLRRGYIAPLGAPVLPEV